MAKIKIFDDNKSLKITKIITLSCLGILFIWFTFDMTGLSFGSTKIVTSAFIDESIDFIFWLVLLGCIVLFVLKDNIGKYIVTAYLFFWSAFQFSIYFRTGERIISYNNFFADTHHIIAASQEILIKDTYHIFLDIFILLSFIAVLVFLVKKIIKSKKSKGIE